MNNYKALNYIYQSSGVEGAYTLLLLHGTGGDETDLLPIAAKFGEGVNVLSLRGNVSEAGMPRFFKRLAMGVFDEADVAFRTHEMVAFIKELAAKEKFDPAKLIALGYSNGANIAGSTMLLYPDFLAGAILLRPMQPFKKLPQPVKTSRRIPVFMSNGVEDPTVRAADSKAYQQLLEDAGFAVNAFNLEAGHNLTLRDIEYAIQWFEQNFETAAIK